MTDSANKGKIIEFSRDIEPAYIERSDGSREPTPETYNIKLADGSILCLIGVNFITARICKRIYDEGFNEDEIRRISCNKPFSDDPEILCDNIMRAVRIHDQLMFDNLKVFLKDLLSLLSPDEVDSKAGLLDVSGVLSLVKMVAGQMRLPENLRLSQKINKLEISGDDSRDRNAVNEILDIIALRKIRTMPDA